MFATPRNMKAVRIEAGERIAAPGVIAYSHNTGEEYSASDGDYGDADPDEPLLDRWGHPMILVRRQQGMVEL